MVKIERNVEAIVADILLPKLYFEDVLDEFEETDDSYLTRPKFKQKNFELFYGGTFEDYTEKVRRFVTARKRSYNFFRDFLDENSELYYTRDIANLSNKQIDSIFDLILEYDGEEVLVSYGLESDEFGKNIKPDYLPDDMVSTDEVRGEEIFLDLRKIRILGFNEGVDKNKVNSLVEAIEKGTVFPPVKVIRSGQNIYSLTSLADSGSEKSDGGHYRAYAHLLAGKKLKCEIVPFFYLAPDAKIAIQDLVYRE